MTYLHFLLNFCALMILFEFAWIVIALIQIGIVKRFKSEKAIFIGMIIEKILYCIFLMSSTILLIQEYRISNPHISLMIFMIFISLVYFIFFFADKRNNAQKSTPTYLIYSDEYKTLTNRLMIVEIIAIFIFIPMAFYPEIISNNLTLNIYKGLYYIATIKFLGVIIGIYGFFSLGKYLFAICLSSIFIFSKNK